ncbi:putative P450 oxidoreductase [Saitoella complicata NRRL Y-17804]|nr:putative P450 oxidoreductase [Saitoella complicata NRRL Y-17804]ODQ53507.1 putative P450 oxidoreductase [Saitoella complicata NRRL Y-17804]
MPGVGRTIFLCSPDSVEHILKTNFENYEKGCVFNSNLKALLGDGIFNVDGHAWKTQRKVASYIFTARAFKTVIAQVFESETNRVIDILRQHAHTNPDVPLDLQALFYRFTLNSFSLIAFSKDLHLLDDLEKPVEFSEAFDYAQETCGGHFTKPYWKYWERFTSRGRKFEKMCKVIDEMTYSIINEKKNQPKYDTPPKAGTKDLMDLFMEYRDEEGNALNEKELRDIMLNFILAGRDTTANVLTWSVHLLLLNKETASLPSPVTYDTIRQHTYAYATLYETLRLRPSVPRNRKLALKDDIVPCGVQNVLVKAGDSVMWIPWAMGRQTDIWGDDALEFKPTRWLEPETSKLKAISPYQSIAFHAGPRQCLGKVFAEQEALRMLLPMTSGFEFERVGSADVGYEKSLTHPMRGGLWVKVKERT